ncbi:MAG: nuclear transport factor 2 family protein [Acidimicrobiales bacterium]
MNDFEAIQQLVSRYNIAFDDMDVEGWIECFTEDAYFNRSNAERSYRGHDELRELINEFSTTFKGRHITTNYDIHVDGDRATMSCYLQLLDRDNNHSVAMFAVYDDELRKVGGEWKFTQRLLQVD